MPADSQLCACALSRAAARCNKGIEVLLAVALEHFVLVVVRVLRGPTQADESAKKLRKLVHCQWCEERVFLKLGNMEDGEFDSVKSVFGLGLTLLLFVEQRTMCRQ